MQASSYHSVEKMRKHKDKLGILVLCGSIYPHRIGGAELHTYYVSKKLVEIGHDVHVITIAPRKNVEQKAKAVFKQRLAGAPLSILLPRGLAYLFETFVRSYIRRREFDVVQVHMALGGMIPAYMLLKISGKPYVVTCHGSDIRIRGKRAFTRFWQKVLLRRAAHVVAISLELRDLLIQEYGLSSRNITIIPNGYDEKLVQRLRAKVSTVVRHKTPSVVFLGSLRDEKDPVNLIEAFRVVSQRLKNIHLQIVGNGHLRTAVEKKIESYKLQNMVTLHGRLPHRQALEVLASSEIFLSTSVDEGTPTSLIEAMALGKAVIATRVGGVPEIVMDGVNGLLTPPKLPEQTAQAIEKLLNNPILTERLKKAALKSVEGYSWSKIAEKYERIYENVSF